MPYSFHHPVWLTVIKLMLLLACVSSASALPSLNSVLQSRDAPTSPGAGREQDVKSSDKRKWSLLTTWGKRNVAMDTHLPVDDDGFEAQKRWTQMQAWGKRDADLVLAEKKWKQMSAWGKRGELVPEKKWKQMSAWGKRQEPLAEKRWSQMSAWGKRDDMMPEKKWKQMSAWGKRDDIIPEKRWKQMSAWGKRDDIIPEKRWKQMSAWGKRDDITPEKRWKQMSAWGKRDDFMPDKKWKQMSAWGKRDDFMPDKKWKQMSAWGKRDLDGFSKKWSQMSAWGKRAATDLLLDELQQDDVPVSDSLPEAAGENRWYLDAPSEQTMSAELDSAVPVKASVINRDNSNNDYLNLVKDNLSHAIDISTAKKKWANRKDWGKRPSWSRTGFSSWGKRSADNLDVQKLHLALLRLKPTLESVSSSQD